MTSEPIVSIVVPFHDSERFLLQTVDAIRQQSFTRWEAILVDDGSRDGSLALAREAAASDPRIRVLALDGNMGAAVARNAGIAAANGRYLAFCDSDDVWSPEKLEKQLAHFAATGAAISFTAYRRVDVGGREIGRVGARDSVSFEDLLRSCFIGCSTAMADLAVTGKVLMPLVRRRQDYGFWLTLASRGHTARGLDEVLVTYRVRPGSISSNKFRAAWFHWVALRDVARIGFWRRLWVFPSYVFHAVGKRLPSKQSLDYGLRVS